MQERCIFYLEYNKWFAWGEISNFISKYIEKIPFGLEELKGIHYTYRKLYENTRIQDVYYQIKNGKWSLNEIDSDRLIDILSNEKCAKPLFLIRINDEYIEDVVELQKFYLLCNAFAETEVVLFVFGLAGDYFKASHYLSWVTEDDRFYNRVFFEQKGKGYIQRLQRNNIGKLRKFLPLLPVTEEMIAFMKQPVQSVLSQNTIKKIIEDKDGTIEGRKEIVGAETILYEQRKLFKSIDIEDLWECFSRINILTFILFCFSIRGEKSVYKEIKEIQYKANQISIWGDGCLQLMENIVFHSGKKCGIFSCRVFENNSLGYLSEKYGKKSILDGANWIELTIADYSGTYCGKNMAEVFKDRLDGRKKSGFEMLKPIDFFDSEESESIAEAWKAYYAEKHNLIHHYGLHIFRNTVERAGGFFVVQSHSGHISKEGEVYPAQTLDEKNNAKKMPGTVFSVLYPTKHNEDVENNRVDYGINWNHVKIKPYVDFTDLQIQNIELGQIEIPKTELEKISIIERLTYQYRKKNQVDALLINAALYDGSQAELLCKSIILELLEDMNAPHFVFFKCSEIFVQMFLDIMYRLWNNLKYEGAYDVAKKQIVLYSEIDYEEVVIIPSNWKETVLINKKNNFSRETKWKNYFEQWNDQLELSEESTILRIPFDIMIKDNGELLFEKYVKKIVSNDIQKNALGCKIENTHMRLGSTIHVGEFYEAEILFGNSFFVERFAMMILRHLVKTIDQGKISLDQYSGITIYGYANYSEPLVFRMMQLFQKLWETIDIDYAILERETEDRGFTHIDRIRYSKFFYSVNERKRHFKNRGIICVIPISSTLKTNEKMIHLFDEENNVLERNILKNYELILVSSVKENKYWEKKGKQVIGKERMEIKPYPEFFVEVQLEYLEPLECPLCFPKKAMDEVPLIEVNAASTIPNQAFGMKTAVPMTPRQYKISKEEIKKEEKKIEAIKQSMLYNHLERGENHFLFYFQTDLLMISKKQEIKEWLKSIKKEKIQVDAEDYIILVSPSHFSNAGFVEYVNEIVFDGMAVVIRDDIDKEYRCNFRTKYSNIKSFAKKLKEEDGSKSYTGKMRFFFIDDAIISGRTFYRSKSLVQSLIDENYYEEEQKYNVFEGIFVLIDRHSKSSRWQFVGLKGESFYAFRELHISSIRNHGDSCVLCNLKKEAAVLKDGSVTRSMSDYWAREEKNFLADPLVSI